MKFIKHSELEGAHAFLSASKHSWLRYSDEKLRDTYINNLAKEHGTQLHEFASQAIKLGIKLPRTKQTLNMFVNDAIGFHMESEQVLFYSYNCFGTADAISFDGKMLRIHDLKTGTTDTHMEQLEIYAALFCHEYNINPFDIQMELRIYQNDECRSLVPDPEDVKNIMDTIVRFDKQIEKIKSE